ncbi:hypothetical protein B0I35DRAFT_476762 [Stachybotrys elegans]|uniref:SET domain-containing protein n=1 Tax=Stachybotrys elegans TaxID=80388 RepID=A0A8K0SXE8_9HYPO|nr:hypothetical protein B0I35DRAFT_476762 [Stachybotrys elegans]
MAPPARETMERYKALMERESGRKGRVPARRPRRDDLILHHAAKVEGKEQDAAAVAQGLAIAPLKPMDRFYAFIAPPGPVSLKPFADLQKVTIHKLLQETRHEGKYLLLRAVTDPDREVCINTIVEDEKGHVIGLSLYFQPHEQVRPAKAIITKGEVAVVKEPYLKLTLDGYCMIQVIHPSDFELLAEDDERIPSKWRKKKTGTAKGAGDWRLQGVGEFNAGRPFDAIKSYYQALKCPSITSDDIFLAYINRSKAYAKTEEWELALNDCKAACELREPNEKLILRMAQAHYNLEQWREALVALQPIASGKNRTLEGSKSYSQCMKRMIEHSRGNYCFRDLYAEMRVVKSPFLDRASYIGPVEVRETGDRGRGLFATQDLKAGDLVLCEKAFAYISYNHEYGGETLSTPELVCVEPEAKLPKYAYAMMQTIIGRLRGNPSLINSFKEIRSGNKPLEVCEVDGVPTMNLWRALEKLKQNLFEGPVSTRDEFLRVLSGKTSQARPSKGDDDYESATGLWLKMAAMNHNCLGNTRRSVIGDMAIIRASQDIAAGSELTHEYEPRPRPSTFKVFKKGIAYQETQGMRDAIMELFNEEVNKSLDDMDATRQCEVAMLELQTTYTVPDLEIPRSQLWEVQVYLGRRFDHQNTPIKAVNMLLRSFRSLGFVIEGGTLPREEGAPFFIKKWGHSHITHPDVWRLLADIYRRMAPDLVSEAERLSRLSYKIVIGEDETYEETAAELMATVCCPHHQPGWI